MRMGIGTVFCETRGMADLQMYIRGMDIVNVVQLTVSNEIVVELKNGIELYFSLGAVDKLQKALTRIFAEGADGKK